MTVDDFVARLSAFGESVNDLTQVLQEFGDEVTTEIKAKAPIDTGALRSSIQASATPSQLRLEMLDYGLFQNYGVVGTESDPGAKVSEPQWGTYGNKKYQFGAKMIGGNLPFGARVKIARQGLKPKNFFSVMTLARDLADRIEQATVDNF